MPILQICCDQSLEAALSRSSTLIAELQRALCDRLDADAAKCQVVMTRGFNVSPLPIFAEIQFRENTHRNSERIAELMQSIAEILTRHLHAGVRIRCFAIEQASLHALDVPG